MNLLGSDVYLADLERVLRNADLSELRNNSVFVTGGLGLICSAVVDTLIEYCLRENASIQIYIGARNLDKYQQKYQGYDFCHYVPYDAEKQISLPENMDYIVHGASLASPEKYTANPVETITTNILGTNNLLEYCKRFPVKKFLYISSSEVYGMKRECSAFKEDSYGTINIDSVRASYPVSKQASEVLCRAYAAEYGVNAVIARPGHIFGPGASPLDKRVSSEFVYKAARGEPIILKSAGLQRRSYQYSLDAAAALLTVMLNGRSGESYNIGAEEETTILEMARYCSKAGNVELYSKEPSLEEREAFNPMLNSALSIDKIMKLGYRDTFSVEEGIFHTIMILREGLKESPV